jgi:nicotinamide-nucleotide amidase
MSVSVPPRISLICIGNELLSGIRVNSNATFIHHSLKTAGYDVRTSTMVGDERESMYHVFKQQWLEHDVVITTGGLGPTSDDITLPLLAEFFETSLLEDADQRQRVERFFQQRGREMTDSNRTQFLRLENGGLLPNSSGTAPGHLWEQEGKLWISLPGVPFEMKKLLLEQVIPMLRERWQVQPQPVISLRLAGIGESALYDYLIQQLELSELGQVAFLPSLQGHLMEVHSPSPKAMETLQSLLAPYLVSASGATLAEAVIMNLVRSKLTLATAESCTGGLLGQMLTAVPGSSQAYPGGVITYSDTQKTNLLGVSSDTLTHHGAVSQSVVEEMARQVRERLSADFGLAISGVAGPDGGTVEKPVGTIWHAISSDVEVRTSQRQFFGDRETNRLQAAGTALTMLFHHLRDTKRWQV